MQKNPVLQRDEVEFRGATLIIALIQRDQLKPITLGSVRSYWIASPIVQAELTGVFLRTPPPSSQPWDSSLYAAHSGYFSGSSF
jgi:hypothetical protein